MQYYGGKWWYVAWASSLIIVKVREGTQGSHIRKLNAKYRKRRNTGLQENSGTAACVCVPLLGNVITGDVFLCCLFSLSLFFLLQVFSAVI
jgi:hypothetical protein